MHHRNLRELAKFASGLVAADLISIIWFTYHGLLPISAFGATFTETMVWPAIAFDAALLGFLLHFAWRLGEIPALRERTYLLLVGIVFGIVALAHFARIFTGTDLIIMGWDVPHWLSWTASIVTAYLSYMSLHLAMRLKR